MGDAIIWEKVERQYDDVSADTKNGFFRRADNCAKYPLFDVLLGIVSTIFTDKEAKVMKSWFKWVDTFFVVTLCEWAFFYHKDIFHTAFELQLTQMRSHVCVRFVRVSLLLTMK